MFDEPNPDLAMLGPTPTEDELKPYERLHTFEIERRKRDSCDLDHGLDDAYRKKYARPNPAPPSLKPTSSSKTPWVKRK